MKFLVQLDNDEVSNLLDTLSTTMLFYNGIKLEDIQSNPALITSLTNSLIELVKHNTEVKQSRDLAIMEIGEEQLVRKVERNGRVLGVILGGKS